LSQFERLFWTGSYYRQGVLDTGVTKNMVSTLQVAGDWYGDMLGFDTGVSDERVKTALQTIGDICGKHSKYGVRVCVNPDGSPDHVWQCYIVGTGWAFFYASHCMYAGKEELSLRIAHEVWQQYLVETARVPWRQEEVIEDPLAGSVTDRLLRDYRMAVIMTLSYSAAGLRWNVPAKTATFNPADWVWKDPKIVLPIILPTWLGQMTCERSEEGETYTFTSLKGPVELDSLRLRTSLRGEVAVYISGEKKTTRVDYDGTMDIGPVLIPQRFEITVRRWQE